MNKILTVLFLAIIFVFTQNIVASYASYSDDNSDTSIQINSSDKSYELDDDEDEDINEVEDNQDDSSNRVISIIPDSIPSENILPTTTPTQTTDYTVTPTPTQTTGINPEASQNESESASFNFINELQKLLSSLKKIIFNTLS